MMRASSSTRAVLATIGLLAAACASGSPPDPFALGRLPRTERSAIRLVALYAVPDVEEVMAFANREGYFELPDGSGKSEPLFEIAWEDVVQDALRSTFASAMRVESLTTLTQRDAGDVEVAIEVVDVEIERGVGSRVSLRWTVSSRTGAVLWRDTLRGEAEEDDALGVLYALRAAASSGRRAVMRDPGWRRYERALTEAVPGCDP